MQRFRAFTRRPGSEQTQHSGLGGGAGDDHPWWTVAPDLGPRRPGPDDSARRSLALVPAQSARARLNVPPMAGKKVSVGSSRQAAAAIHCGRWTSSSRPMGPSGVWGDMSQASTSGVTSPRVPTGWSAVADQRPVTVDLPAFRNSSTSTEAACSPSTRRAVTAVVAASWDHCVYTAVVTGDAWPMSS